MKEKLPYGNITEAVIGAAFEVHRILGYGFLEAVYRNAMAVELRHRGFGAEMEKRLEVHYKSEPVGLLINFGRLKVEFKRLAWNLGETVDF